METDICRSTERSDRWVSFLSIRDDGVNRAKRASTASRTENTARSSLIQFFSRDPLLFWDFQVNSYHYHYYYYYYSVLKWISTIVWWISKTNKEEEEEMLFVKDW